MIGIGWCAQLTCGGTMPEQVSGGGKVLRVQQGQIGLPELHNSTGELGQARVLKGLLGDDWGALTQQAGSQQALYKCPLLPILTCCQRFNFDFISEGTDVLSYPSTTTVDACCGVQAVYSL